MDWHSVKEEEEQFDVSRMEGLDLDNFEFLNVLGTSEFDLPSELMPNNDDQQQTNVQSQMDPFVSHPFFTSPPHEQQQYTQQHNNPFHQQQQNQSGMFEFQLTPSTSSSQHSSSSFGSLPEIQISEFPPQSYFGSFSTSPSSSSQYPLPSIIGSGEHPIVQRSGSPTSSGYTSPLSHSGHAVPTFHITSGTLASSGSGSAGVSLGSSASGGHKRKKPPKKKQASLPTILPAPSTTSPGPILSTSPTSSSSFPSMTPMHHLSPSSSPPMGNSPPTSPRGLASSFYPSWADLQMGGKSATLTVPGMGQAAPKILRVNYDEVIFSAAKTPSKVTVVCSPTSLRPLGIECLINRPNLPQPVVVQPTQISIHDDSNEQRVATCTVIECHFPFPTIMKTCVGGVKVANVQFRLLHSLPSSPTPILLDSFYKDDDMRHLPMVAYPHTKAKIQCWAIIIWYADRGPEYEQLTWAELAKRFAYFYKRQLNESMHPQSIRFLGEKLGIPNAGKESSKDDIVTFETYMQNRVGHWLYNAVQAIKTYYDLWRNYSLRMFLTHKDAVILLKQMGANPGDFLFRIPSQLAEEDTKAFKTRSPSSNLVFTYVQKVEDEIKFAKVDVNDKTREDPKFVYDKKELVNVLCLNEKGDMILRHKTECCFNEKQKKMKENAGFKGTVKVSGDDGDEYETY